MGRPEPVEEVPSFSEIYDSLGAALGRAPNDAEINDVYANLGLANPFMEESKSEEMSENEMESIIRDLMKPFAETNYEEEFIKAFGFAPSAKELENYKIMQENKAPLHDRLAKGNRPAGSDVPKTDVEQAMANFRMHHGREPEPKELAEALKSGMPAGTIKQEELIRIEDTLRM